MFGSSAPSSKDGEAAIDSSSNDPKSPSDPSNPMAENALEAPGSPVTNRKSTDDAGNSERRRRSSGVAKAKDIFASAKSSFHVHSVVAQSEKDQTPIQRLSKADPALGVPQGSLNNSAGDSMPGPRSTFRVGVTEDKNKKCRRTMEDTHAYLYNFLSTPQATSTPDVATKSELAKNPTEQAVAETDNGYFAIFDGHAGTFAADWCGKKLHLILEDTIRRNPSTPIPELLDQTFTSVDQQLEKLPVKNSGCTAVIAVLRWEDRVPNNASATGSTYLNQAAAKVSADSGPETTAIPDATTPAQAAEKLKDASSRQRVLYTANVGDARIVLCRNGRALRLSYDHKGSDEQEGRRVSNAGGLILNNRVNGVLAVTRALGDAYMKDLVTGHPYTTETVIQHETDEFMILACDGLWDVCSDQEAVDLIRNIHDPQAASKQLVDHALARFSTDNLSCMVVRYDNKALKALKDSSSIGVEGDPDTIRGSVSEADAIVSSVKRLQDETGEAGVEKMGAHTANDMIVEEEELHTSTSAAEPGPELNAEAVEKAKKNIVTSR